jgi:hypothetical protein
LGAGSPRASNVVSPFDAPAPKAEGFGVEETRKGFEKGGKPGTPAASAEKTKLLEKTEIMSPEERKHGRPPKPRKADSHSKIGKKTDSPSKMGKKADSPSKIGKRADSPSKISKGDSPSKIAKRRESPSKITKPKPPPLNPAVMKTQPMRDAPRRPEKSARHAGLIEPTLPLSQAKAKAKEKPAAREPSVIKRAPHPPAPAPRVEKPGPVPQVAKPAPTPTPAAKPRPAEPLPAIAISGPPIFRDAILRGARLVKADLRGADLSGSDLAKADLSDADLSYAKLDGVDLSRAKTRGTKLEGAR